MAVAVRRVSDRRTINLKSLDHLGDRFLKPEVRKFTSQVALEENRAQVVQGNFPSRVVIDRRTTIDLSPADARALARAGNNVTFIGLDRNIRFYYTSNGTLAQALTYAWDLLRSLTRVGPRGPHAVSSYYIWCSDLTDKARSKKFKEVDGAVKWIVEARGQVRVAILGPTYEYRRQLIYNPEGRKQQTRWVSAGKGINEGPARDRYTYTGNTKSKVDGKQTGNIAVRSHRRGGKTFYQAQVAKAIQQIVVQNVKRQFRDLMASYRFVPSKELPLPLYKSPKWRPTSNVHIPELGLIVKRQHGRIR